MASGLGYSPMARSSYQQPEILYGNHFSLACDYKKVNFTGKDRVATSINGRVPAPVLRWKQGERVTLDVTNNLAVDSSIHWHGMILPSAMDGVPGISDDFQGIKPGQTFRYEFDVKQSGTYWYHSHSGFQEQTGAYGAIIIDPIEPYYINYERLLGDTEDIASAAGEDTSETQLVAGLRFWF
jgi:FtsP/CotA-like multicopper oxidase with cupredoxin domain